MDMMEIRRRILANTPHIETVSSGSFFTDMIAPMKSLAVIFSPVQSGSGDPSPTNIRPLSGRTSITVAEGNEYSILLGRMAYGGIVDFATGKLEIDMVMNTYDGSSDENWKAEYLGSTKTYNFYMPSASMIPKPRTTAQYSEDSTTNASRVKCNQARPRKWTSSGTETYGAGLFYIAASGTMNINGGLFEVTTAEDFKAYLSEHPLQVAYEIATHEFYQLTPEQIKAIKGQNAITSQDGTVTKVIFWTH